MAVGYLFIKTHPDEPLIVRVLISSARPGTSEDLGRGIVRYVARFDDVDAGQMHAHNILGRTLIDLDSRRYRVSVTEAIAAVESDNLSHRRVWIDPELTQSEVDEITDLVAKRVLNAQRADRAWYAVGLAFVVLLFLQILGFI